ncbi:hypothetical protein ACFL3A_08115 [Pseudomonadota bacterium]
MNTVNPTPVRHTAICVFTALAISLPGTGSAGLYDKAKARTQAVKAKVSNTVSTVRQNQPIASAFQNLGQNLPGTELIDQVHELNPMEQFQNTRILLNQMQADYQYFSGGEGCAAECATFRMDLKTILDDFLRLADEVPALNANSRITESIQRTSGLIDYIPPRALYLMWQAIGSRLDDLHSVPDQIRGILAALPPVEDIPDITVGYANIAGEQVAGSRMCEWADKEQKPFIELYQAKLEKLAWVLKTVEGFIPDVEAEGEVGVEAGIAVGMVTGSAAVSLKPTDQLKIALKALAVVPESVNWMIKMNTLRAKAVCATATLVAEAEWR